MNEIKLTKDAEKMLSVIFKEYSRRRKDGDSKRDAKCFHDFEEWSQRLLPKIDQDDVLETQYELCRAFGLKKYIRGGFILSDESIEYMEKRFANKVKDGLDIVSKFIPLMLECK